MEEVDIPSISSGPVGSRFVSQTDLDQAKANREAQWKAAYARLVSISLAFLHNPPMVLEWVFFNLVSGYPSLDFWTISFRL